MVTTGTSSDLVQDAKSMLRTTPGNMIDRGRADKAAARQLEHEWAVILAGGDGARLRSLTRRITGDERPKQFCPVLGDQTLVEETRKRVALEVARERTLFLVNRLHERYYYEILSDTPAGNLIEQPRNIGTAPAILYSLMKIAAADSQAVVAFFPIQSGFRDVSDALVQYQRVREIRGQRELMVTALQDRKRLAYVRYRGGVDTMLNALNADQELFVAELSLAQARRDELLSVVQLYKALGGGWQ
jgi:Nucleotidyl transferase/Outer membrane efflux protein